MEKNENSIFDFHDKPKTSPKTSKATKKAESPSVTSEVKQKRQKKEKPKSNVRYCEFCNKRFIKEVTYNEHSCELKRKNVTTTTRIGLFAFSIWEKYVSLNKIRLPAGVLKLDVFARPSNFNFFIEFALFLNEQQPLFPDEYAEFVMHKYKNSNQWMLQESITEWIIHKIKLESPADAITRSIEAIHQWSMLVNSNWVNFFKEVSSDRGVLWISTGKISPWLLYACDTSDEFLSKLSDSEFEYICKFIDPMCWSVLKFNHKDEFEKMRKILKEYGL